MMNARHIFCAALLAGTISCPATEEPLSRIAFGSCANESRPQPVWEAINKLKPQLFIFTGDNVYADTADPVKLRNSYEQLAAIPGFSALRETCPVIGTWDDHDYGKNDAGEEFEGKQAAKDAFMKFFDTPEDSPLRKRGGVYDARIFGPEGKRVQVILLDTRWFRGPLERMPKEEWKALRKAKGKWHGPYLPAADSDSTMLGSKQWEWLAAELKKPADLRLIVSGIQVVPIDHGWEKWGNLPKERRRLFELIRDSAATGVVFLTGDRHTADISMLPHETDGSPAYPLYDVTSSGLNQNGFSKETNRYRAEKEKPFGKPNFGLIEIDWSQEDPSISMQIRDAKGKVVRKAETTLGQLKRCSL
jgi:alkaline phosphatase D